VRLFHVGPYQRKRLGSLIPVIPVRPRESIRHID
jgi:hypothetical protein